MRRYFGGASDGMGGGIMRSAVRAGGVGGGAIQDSFSCSTNNNNIKKRTTTYADKNTNNIFTLSSSNKSSPFTSPPRYRGSGTRSVIEETDREYVNDMDHKRRTNFNKYFDDVVFGSVPSLDEVQHAVSAIQEVAVNLNEEEESICDFNGIDWIEPSLMHLGSSAALRPRDFDRVGGVLDLLKADPSVQKMVVSISSDEAIWNAVLNNEAVREFRDSVNEDAGKRLSSSDNSNAAIDIARWVVNQIQAKVSQLVEKIMLVFHDVFQSSDEMKEGKVSPFEGKLRSSFFLSLVVMLMVVVTRAHGA